jgi:hypothetical protein
MSCRQCSSASNDYEHDEDAREDFGFHNITRPIAKAGKTVGGGVANAGKKAGGGIAGAGKAVGGGVVSAGKAVGGFAKMAFGGLWRLLGKLKWISSLCLCCLCLVYLGPIVFPAARGLWAAVRAGRRALGGANNAAA